MNKPNCEKCLCKTCGANYEEVVGSVMPLTGGFKCNEVQCLENCRGNRKGLPCTECLNYTKILQDNEGGTHGS